MIGTFWSLCRACPSVPPVDKLHSEYRSTYRWHEYTGPRQEIVRRPPQNTYISPSNNEPNLHRRKKYPELAYRAHDFLVSIDNSGSDGLIEKTIVYDRARSEERWGASRQKSSRRSKSEGPPGEQPSYRLIYTKSNNVTQHKSRDRYLNDENVAPPNANRNESMRNTSSDRKSKNEPKKGTSEYTLQFAWPPANKSFNSRIDDIYSQHTPRKSVSMNGIKSKGTYAQDTVPVHKKTHYRNQSEMEVLRTLKPNTDIENVKAEEQTQKHGDEVDSEFKSEYRKNFQSFTKYDFDETKGFTKQVPLDSSFHNENEIDSPSSSWYKEVVFLRKKANQYRYRGWGTELVPDHIAQVYTNQMMVWDQVSRRSSLSALALASTILTKDRCSSRDDKEKENRKHSPTKSLTRLRSAKSSHDSSGNHESRIKSKNVANVRNINAKNRTECSPNKGNTRAKKSVVERSSPKNTSRNTKESNAPATIHSKVSAQGSDKPKRRPRPTSLVTSVPSGSKSSFTKKKDESGKQTLVDINKKGRRRTDEAKKSEEPIVVSKEESEPTGEEVPDFPDVGDEQIVKSPPEPTRVKSPEQIVMRSPEPVNWTVPLDTGKTFTVTQNVHEGDLVPRSYSEARAWTPTSAPPPASISAPTELLELAKTKIPG